MTFYCASKTRHADKWKALRAAGNPVNSTWIDEAGPGDTLDFAHLWVRCVTEASEADALLLYCDHDDGPEILKGALVEVGAALGAGKPVFAVGVKDWQGSWVNHPLVIRCRDIQDAVERIRQHTACRDAAAYEAEEG